VSKHSRVLIGLVAALAAGAAGALWLSRSPAQEKAPGAGQPAPAPQEGAGEKSPDVAAVRKAAAAFVKAFNAGDAKAVAALWTRDGEYVGPDGEKVRGRAALEKEFAEFFKKHPKARLEAQIESVRLFGAQTALEEGTLKVQIPGVERSESRYSVLHVREGDGWRVASVREWVPDPAEAVSLNDLAWLVGEWVAKAEKIEVRTIYSWGADKLTLQCRYTIRRDGKETSSGTQIIGKDPARGLRSWLFDRSGAFGESVWERDGDRWVIDAAGTLPDGSELSAVNILIPLDADTFTWQSVERTAAGTPLPDVPPVRVTRVKAGK
jgi:uncharacterized protein (TIGR02246 family)